MATRYLVIKIEKDGDKQGQYKTVFEKSYQNLGTAEALQSSLQRVCDREQPGKYQVAILEVEA